MAEIPEELHESLKRFLETHPKWDQDRVFAAALSLFLLQNSNCSINSLAQETCLNKYQDLENYRACAKVYLETLFEQSS
ncbi:MAG: DUF2811 domain-containing protein [Cyanobacteria bacterium J083]|nr:MAG: DUF2811 domain-containing protein [Cyanobacteria bacterium J083]